MATIDEAHQALLDSITQTAKDLAEFKPGYRAEHLIKLTEAFAWLRNPNQPHGASHRAAE